MTDERTEAEELDAEFSNDNEVRKVMLGMEAQALKSSNIGVYLLDRAKVEIEQALEELIDADPEDVKLQRDIRQRIQVAGQFEQWLDEAISAAADAERLIHEEDYD